MPDAVGGAWLGGTLDTTGSVVAAGELISQTAMKIGTIVKFSQNVLIGFAAFFLSFWWTMRQPAALSERPTLGVIWERFPKFVSRLHIASLIFSFLIPARDVKSTTVALNRATNLVVRAGIRIDRARDALRGSVAMEGGRPASHLSRLRASTWYGR